MSPQNFRVVISKNQLSRKNRPKFINSTINTLKVDPGQDRRHILHGATQITDVIILALNWVIDRYNQDKCIKIVDELLTRFKQRGISYQLDNDAPLTKKVEKLISIAFSSCRNLVVGSYICNQGIEKARTSIIGIRDKLNKYCVELREFGAIKARAIQLIEDVLKGGDGEIAKYRLWILKVLKESIAAVQDVLALNYILHDFEFSCTLDIAHTSTTKTQNIWGLEMANRLQRAIENKNTDEVFVVLV